MDSPQPLAHTIFISGLDPSSLASLLKRGLAYAKEGRYAEGVSLFILVRECLSPSYRHLITMLDVFIQGYVDYWEVQQTLHHASKRFVEIEAAQRDNTLRLHKMLLTLTGELHAGLSNEAPSLADQQYPDQKAASLESEASFSRDQIQQTDILAPLHFTCFGRFEVRRQNKPLLLCSNRKGQTILRYLVTQPEHCATMDVLMTELWPDDEQKVAHHKLQVAVSALRCSLNSGYDSAACGGYILCKQGMYQLNPAVALHSDVDEFTLLYQTGQRAAYNDSIPLYEQACALYTGQFLPEDLYTDWSSLRREQLCRLYLSMCGVLLEHYRKMSGYEQAIIWANAILKENRCDEEAYRQLMHIYAAQGRRSEALRQYYRCRQILSDELGVEPMSETMKTFNSLLNSDAS